jgi:hypothetical protein
MSGTKREQGAEACGVGLCTETLTDSSDAPRRYDEPEGTSPGGKPTCVAPDRDSGMRKNRAPLRRHLGAGAGRQDGAADPLQQLPRAQGAQPGRQRRRPVHGLPDGQDRGAGAGGGTFLYDLAKAPKAQR